jgi:Domain of unknown function (DUF5753)/Helix-turn-helix domain
MVPHSSVSITTREVNVASEGPTVQRRQLGMELKKCRERAGMTQDQVGAHFEWHSGKVFRIETARVGVTARDVKDMLALYGVDDEDYRDAMMALARRSKQRSWWADYKDIMRAGSFIGLEAEATSVRDWAPNLIPGLLQTADYARALLTAGLPNPEAAQIDRRVELRMTRQTRLTSDDPLHFSAIIDESVLRRTVGGAALMREQLECLLKASHHPNVNLQVLPFRAGEHGVMGGSATLLEFPEALDLDVVYLEGVAGDYYEEEPTEVARYRRIFERLSASALSRRETVQFITEMLNTGT